MQKRDIIKVAADSAVQQTAGSIVTFFENGNFENVVELRSIGASATNQAYKAVAAARNMIAPKGHDLVLRPFFLTDYVDGEKKTIMSAVLSIIKE
jgi:stage V sporulation protein SpoVS